MSNATWTLLAFAYLAAGLTAQSTDRLQILPSGSVSNAVVSDSAGNLYIGGTRNKHGFIEKRSPDGATTQYQFTTGGSGPDSITGIALGSEGAIFATGTTTAADFPAGRGSDLA